MIASRFTNTGNDESLPRRNNYVMRKSSKGTTRSNQWIEERLDAVGRSKIGLGKAMGLPPSRVTEIIDGERAVKSNEIVRMADYRELYT